MMMLVVLVFLTGNILPHPRNPLPRTGSFQPSNGHFSNAERAQNRLPAGSSERRRLDSLSNPQANAAHVPHTEPFSNTNRLLQR